LHGWRLVIRPDGTWEWRADEDKIPKFSDRVIYDVEGDVVYKEGSGEDNDGDHAMEESDEEPEQGQPGNLATPS
jgi:hypothetical protein